MIKTDLVTELDYQLQRSNMRIEIPESSVRSAELPECMRQLTHLQNCSHEHGNCNIHISKKTRRIYHMKN